jgi:hypothetical protein
LAWVQSVDGADSLEINGLTISPGPDQTELFLEGATAVVDSSYLLRGARALVAYGLHLGHNEFEGGFVVADGEGDEATLKVGSKQLVADGRQIVALLKGLINRLESLLNAG